MPPSRYEWPHHSGALTASLALVLHIGIIDRNGKILRLLTRRWPPVFCSHVISFYGILLFFAGRDTAFFLNIMLAV